MTGELPGQAELFATASLPLVEVDGPGQARATDPDTAHAAAAARRWRKTSARAQLLGAFVEAGAYGLTDEQAAELAGLSLLSEYATRCSELRALALVEDTEERRPGSSGLARVVRRVTGDGRALWSSWQQGGQP